MSSSVCSRKQYRMEERRKMKARQQSRATSDFTGISSSSSSSSQPKSSSFSVAGLSISNKSKTNVVKRKNGSETTSSDDAATIATAPPAVSTTAATTSTKFAIDLGDSSSSSSLIKKDWRNLPEVAVLVSDLSGFTSTTRKYGIIHFASVIIRMRQLVLPIFHKYNALEITTEADNFITVFKSCRECILASIEMRQIIQTYNSTLLPTERKHFQIKLNGIGISCSKGGLIMDHSSLLHGKVFEQAYHLGEDICDNSNILITQPALDVLRKELPSIQVEEHIVDDDDDDEEEELDFTAYRIIFDPLTSNALQDTNYSPPKLIDYDDGTFLPHQLLPFAKRHDPTIDLQTLDSEIKMKYGSKVVTVLMFHFQSPQDEEQDNDADPLKCLQIIHSTLSQVLRPILTTYNGMECEPELWLFDDPNDAVRAVLQAKVCLEEKLAQQQQQQQRHGHHRHQLLHVEGWGLHQGTLVVVPETDIHWGDPVNTASKLGQDLATNGDFLISDTVFNVINDKKNDFWVQNHQVKFEPRQLTCSKVDFDAYCVSSSSSSSLQLFSSSTSSKESKNSFFRKVGKRLVSIRRQFLWPSSSKRSSMKGTNLKNQDYSFTSTANTNTAI